MPLNFNQPEQMTSREFTEHEWEKEMFELQATHAVKIKELDIQAAKLKAKITSWFRIPIYIISLPVRILFIVPFCIYVIRGQEIPQEFWELIR